MNMKNVWKLYNRITRNIINFILFKKYYLIIYLNIYFLAILFFLLCEMYGVRHDYVYEVKVFSNNVES